MDTIYGLWADNDGGISEGPFYTEKGAKDRIAELIAEAVDAETAEDLRADLSVVEICPDHEDQRRHACKECAAPEEEESESEHDN